MARHGPLVCGPLVYKRDYCNCFICSNNSLWLGDGSMGGDPWAGNDRGCGGVEYTSLGLWDWLTLAVGQDGGAHCYFYREGKVGYGKESVVDD